MSQVSSYVKEVLGRIKGDKAEVIAAQNERKANAAINSQISQQENALVDAEEEVQEANDRLKDALYPTEKIDDTAGYLKGIADAQADLDSAKTRVTEIKDNIKFYQKLKSDFGQMVNA